MCVQSKNVPKLFQECSERSCNTSGDLNEHCVVGINFRSQYYFRSHSFIFLNYIDLVAWLEGKFNLSHLWGIFAHSMESKKKTPGLIQWHRYGWERGRAQSAPSWQLHCLIRCHWRLRASRTSQKTPPAPQSLPQPITPLITLGHST